jgi:hypothetical protein
MFGPLVFPNSSTIYDKDVDTLIYFPLNICVISGKISEKRLRRGSLKIHCVKVS